MVLFSRFTGKNSNYCERLSFSASSVFWGARWPLPGAATVLAAFHCGLLVRARSFSRLYACRRFSFCSLVANLLATLRLDSEFVGRLRVKLPRDRQILSLLKSANARPGSETEDAIDLPAVVSFVLQSLLHLPHIVAIPDRWYFFGGKVGAQSELRWTWSRDPDRQQYEDNPRARGFDG
jgi:hypothetical protein